MNIEQAMEGADIEDVAPEDAIESEQVEEPQVEEDPYAEEAVKYGWKPKSDDWDGDNWMSAEKFMTRGPGTSRKLEAENKELAQRLEHIKADHEARLRRSEAAIKAAAEAQIAEIKEQQRQAIETGDVEAFDALEKKKESISEPKSDEVSAEDQAAIQGWVADNPQYRTDEVFAAMAGALWKKAEAEGKRSVSEILEYVNAGIAERQAPKNPPKRKSAAVDTGVPPTPAKRRGKGWADIPAEDRSLAQGHIEEGLFDALAKELKLSPQEAYASKYFEGE